MPRIIECEVESPLGSRRGCHIRGSCNKTDKTLRPGSPSQRSVTNPELETAHRHQSNVLRLARSVRRQHRRKMVKKLSNLNPRCGPGTQSGKPVESCHACWDYHPKGMIRARKGTGGVVLRPNACSGSHQNSRKGKQSNRTHSP